MDINIGNVHLMNTFSKKMWNMMEYNGIWEVSIGVYIHIHRIYNQLLVGLFYHERWGIQLSCWATSAFPELIGSTTYIDIYEFKNTRNDKCPAFTSSFRTPTVLWPSFWLMVVHKVLLGFSLHFSGLLYQREARMVEAESVIRKCRPHFVCGSLGRELEEETTLEKLGIWL